MSLGCGQGLVHRGHPENEKGKGKREKKGKEGKSREDRVLGRRTKWAASVLQATHWLRTQKTWLYTIALQSHSALPGTINDDGVFGSMNVCQCVYANKTNL